MQQQVQPYPQLAPSLVLTLHPARMLAAAAATLTGARAPYMVIDHNGQQHQTEVMKGMMRCHGCIVAASVVTCMRASSLADCLIVPVCLHSHTMPALLHTSSDGLQPLSTAVVYCGCTGGAVTVWNTKATFPYAPSSDLVVMVRSPGNNSPQPQ